MPSQPLLLITPSDLPEANLAPAARLSAGRGWLPLVLEALADLDSLPIRAIREDGGALVIETSRGTEAQRERLAAIRAASLHVCELCGEPGELVYEGLRDGRPAGWHRTRCVAHRNWRTSPPFPPEQSDPETGLVESWPMRWKLPCRDAGDGSGDVILELPDDLLQAVGLAAGDTLELEPDPADNSAIRLTKVVLCDVCDASTAEAGHGVLQAQWRDGETEGMRLCRSCFGYAMSTLISHRRVLHLFDDDDQSEP